MKYIKVIILCLWSTALWAATINEFRISDEEFYDLISDPDIEYVFRLYNGNIIQGYITEFIEDEGAGEGIKIATYVGEIKLYHNQIIEAILLQDMNRHSHRAYIMPTARPIGDDHFVGNWEIGLIYGGFGISEYVSVTGGHTFVPGIEQQAWLINAKATVLQQEFEGAKGGYAVAVGYNHASITSIDLGYLYVNGTYYGERTSFTGMVYSRINEQAVPESIVIMEDVYPINVPQGSVGIGFAMDTRFSSWTDVRFVGELWSPDLSRATNSAILAGFRIDNSTVAYDFGLCFVTTPVVIPYFAFSWTPF